jgi:predicted amidophosphoribosyltransferase
MGIDFQQVIFLCPHCMLPGPEAGACPQCGATLVSCRPGEPDDPCRKPLMDRHGRVLTRAPLWWLQYTVRELAQHPGRE